MNIFLNSMVNASGTLGLKQIIARVIPLSETYKRERPKMITDEVLAVLVHEGLAFTTSPDPFEAVKQIRNAGKRVAILPLEHMKYRIISDIIVKDVYPENYLNMDSSPVVRRAIELSKNYAGVANKEWHLPKDVSIDRMTDRLAESIGMYPYFLQRAAAELNIGQPPLGFYWTGNDKRVRFTTWMRCINGHENYLRFKKGEYLMTLPEILYAHSAQITVASQSRPGDENTYTILRMPITSEKDEKQYSEWRKLSVVGDVPDDIWRAKAHLKRDTENILISSCVITGYDGVADRLLRNHELGAGIEMQVNPFPMLTPYGAELVRLLREQTIVGKRGLNMTDMDFLIGADTVTRDYGTSNYDNNFVNWRRGPTVKVK